MSRSQMIPMLSALGLCVLTVSSCGSDSTAPFVCNPGQPAVVQYDALGTFQTDTLVQGGLTATGSNTVNVLNLNGLGVVGGLSDNTIDGTTESLKFVVDAGAAIDVSYFVQIAGTTNPDGSPLAETRVEAFDHAGVSLGTNSVASFSTVDVSAMFDSLPISVFVVTSDGVGDFFRINRVSYTPCQ